MSVAFRRDSDEEHLEPKFDIPLPPGPNLVTLAGLERIAAKVAELGNALPLTTDEEARKRLNRDLRYWRSRSATAEPMPVPNCEKVEFGCRVSFRLNGKPRSIAIVGHDEADPARDILSFAAPLARAMIGAEVGDVVDFNGNAAAIEVTGIEPI